MLEIFSKLNAKRANIAGNGQSLLDVTDICGLLASLDQRHSWYVYAMIEQRRCYNMELLHKYCEQLILQEMLKRKFQPKKVGPSEFASGVTKAALYAYFNPKGKCHKCNGFGKIGIKKCPKCNGNGAREHNWLDRLRYGFPMRNDLSSNWYLKICSHYDSYVVSILIEIENDIIDALKLLKKQERIYRIQDNEVLFHD